MSAFPPIRERVVSQQFRDRMRALGTHQLANSMRAFQMGECRILMSRDDMAPGDLRWHISVSCADRDPSWEEIKHVQNTLKPGVFFCVPMPPREHWMSIHDHAFHLEEVKDPVQIAHWTHEGLEARGLAI